MNIKKLPLFFSFLLLSIVFISCESNEANSLIAGKWNVTEMIGGFSKPKNYKIGSITWTFDTDKKILSIKNNLIVTNTTNNDFTKNETGDYNYKIETENEIDYLIIKNRKGAIKSNEDGFMIDFGIAYDDIGYILKR
ncbi:hypothetical protein [uncultured Polaribacter sp.]|uniref:hypothetical protein n=1 Tax=uncultured Polaribacter sp. TaxID=174711 RepID=UPI00261BBF1B|nr:hypothetical protein [uncultured Polaribacter sp.]